MNANGPPTGARTGCVGERLQTDWGCATGNQQHMNVHRGPCHNPTDQ